MSISVNTNASAILALLNLNKTSDDLTATGAGVSSGLKVASSKDGAATFAIAQTQRADITALSAVTDGLNRASSIADVATAAGQRVSDLLNTLKSTVLSATDASIDAPTRAAYNATYKSLLGEISQAVASASFNGTNLLDGSAPTGVRFMASADGAQAITLGSQNLTLGGPLIAMAATSSINTQTNATAILTQVGSAISGVNQAMAQIGAQSNQIDAHASFVSKLSDTLTAGVGSLVDADVASESARLTALQVQQQLGAQSLSIANQSPSIILSLLKG